MKAARQLQSPPPWVEIALLYKRQEPDLERARLKLSRVFGHLNIGEAFIDFDLADGDRVPFRAQWNPDTRNVAYYSGVAPDELVGVMAHELCHALVRPEPGPEPVNRQAVIYRRDDRVATIVGGAISDRLGSTGYAKAAQAHGYANWLPVGEVAADEVAEAAEIVERIEHLLAQVSVWPGLGVNHFCTTACEDDSHLQPLMIDESIHTNALRWVSILAAHAGLGVIELVRSENQHTPSATVWLVRYQRL